MSEKLAYTIQEAAEACSVSKDTIRRELRVGNITARYPTSRPIIPAEELRDWFEALPDQPA